MKNLTLTPDTDLVRNNKLFASAIDDELVMMDENSGSYFGLNPIARVIWEGLEKPTKFSALIASLTNLYDVSPEQCEQDLKPFLVQLLENNLVQAL